MPLASVLDVGLAIGLAALAALWLVVRAVKAARGRSAGGCGCGGASCPAMSQAMRDVKAAGRRAKAKAERPLGSR